MVNKCDDVSTIVLTHQQVKLVQVGHDDFTVSSPYHRFGHFAVRGRADRAVNIMTQ